MQSIKPFILPTLFEGLQIKKVKSNGKVSTRVLTLSDDLFKFFLSRTNKKRFIGERVVSKAIGTVMATKVDCTQFNVRVIDVADILFVQSGFIGSRKLEAASDTEIQGARIDPTTVVSIFHGNIQMTTDLILDDDEDRKALISSIQIIRDAYRRASIKPNVTREQLLLRYHWCDVDWRRIGFLDLVSILHLLRRINIYVKQEKVKKMYRDYCSELHRGQRLRRSSKLRLRGGSDGYRDHHGISFDECIGLLGRIKSDQNDGKHMCDIVFDQIFGEGRQSVNAQDFTHSFLIERQGNYATTDEARNIICMYGGSEDGDSLDRTSFAEYLFSSENDLFDPAKQRFDENVLSESLSEYWINSSHNTYLTGDQLQSKSSLEAYAVALQRGCRCLELDCFDDKAAGVVVYHGYTATSKILFRDIILVVKNFIAANPEILPIILSLDNNCSVPFQEMMAAILKQELQGVLYYPASTLERLPSPKDLMGKVILKGRRTSMKDDRPTMTEPRVTPKKGAFKDATEIPSHNIAPQLSEITTLNTIRYTDFPSMDALPVTDMLSISDYKFLKILNEDEENVNVTLWKSYNRHHMTRTYPSAARLDSSNFNPVLHWSEGCQMVSLNFQTDDSQMVINDGRFRENGGCGYVPKTISHCPAITKLRIKILAASCLPKPYGESSGEVTSPYVILRLHDVRTASQKSEDLLKSEERKTDTVKDNGFCPQWSDAKEHFFEVESTHVAMLEFSIVHSDEGFIDDNMCRTALPVRGLRQGVRSVQFYDHNTQKGSIAVARLLVSVEIEEHIPWK